MRNPRGNAPRTRLRERLLRIDALEDRRLLSADVAMYVEGGLAVRASASPGVRTDPYFPAVLAISPEGTPTKSLSYRAIDQDVVLTESRGDRAVRFLSDVADSEWAGRLSQLGVSSSSVDIQRISPGYYAFRNKGLDDPSWSALVAALDNSGDVRWTAPADTSTVRYRQELCTGC
jgi:hypothetical protein